MAVLLLTVFLIIAVAANWAITEHTNKTNAAAQARAAHTEHLNFVRGDKPRIIVPLPRPKR